MNQGVRGVRDYIYGKFVEARRKGQGGMFTLTVQGAAEIERRVAELSDLESSKAVRAGLRSGGRLLARRGKERLSERVKYVESNYRAKGREESRWRQSIRRRELSNHRRLAVAAGNLYNSFLVRVKRRSLGALVGFTKKGHHAHLVDLGTTERYTKSGRKLRGVMPANRFWSDTAEQDWRDAMNKVMEGIDRAIYRIMLRRD